MSVHPETYAALVETLYQARLENRRLRISQLRRMADIAQSLARRWAKHLDALDLNDAARIARNSARHHRFRAACLAEIKSLRGIE